MEKWVYVFLALLLGFNAFIFLGSGDGASAPDTAVRGGGDAPPPPPPEAEAGPAGLRLAGPELLMGLVALQERPEGGLTPEQRKAIFALLEQLDSPRGQMRAVAEKAMACLTAEQQAWIRENRGPLDVEVQEVEPGMDPATSAAWKLCVERGSTASAEPPATPVESADVHLHEVVAGILRLETAPGNLAVTPVQAKALAPLLQQGARIRAEETRIFEEIVGQLEEGQVRYLEENPQLVRADVNELMVRYARMALGAP